MNKAMAYLMGADAIAKSNDNLAETIRFSNRELGEKLESISQAEIKSKDRVDITLEEYENMKRTIEKLTFDNRCMRDVLDRIEVPIHRKIIPDSIRNYCTEDRRNFRYIYTIEFAIDEWDMLNNID